jgi:oligopeptide/dipeptide ABC transporter ATP-binding protein
MKDQSQLLVVKNLKTYFPSGKAWFGKQKYIKAVDGVSLHINRNEIIGLVGESGSGKTTLGRSILRLTKSNQGEIIFKGKDISLLKGRALRAIRKEIQLIFQDPYASLSPRLQIHKLIAEPLILHNIVPEGMVDQRVSELLKEVGLENYFKDRYPHEMSGGQRQRIAIARVLGLQPELIIADEPVSALDVSVTAQILNLLKEIQKKNGMSMLFISHDLKVIAHMADRILVMYAGHVVEEATTQNLLTAPLHPYTKLLIASMPSYENRNSTRVINRQKSSDQQSNVEKGCPFVARCKEAQSICKQTNPPLKESKQARFVACHFN